MQADAEYFRESIFSKLVDIQGRMPELIEPEVDIYDAFGMQRSGRRGFTTVATNLGFKEEDISLICRWQTERNRGGRAKFMSMVAAYATSATGFPFLFGIATYVWLTVRK